MDSAGPGLSSADTGNGTTTGAEPSNSAASAAKLRKRTKTGCLTCRKRRIKCGEERPICNNCIKSKRHCEGYNQRVVFKTPIGDWPSHPSTVNTLPYHSSMLPGSRPVNRPTQTGPQPQIQPRPLTQFDFSNVQPGPAGGLEPLNTGVIVGGSLPYTQGPHYPQASPHTQLPTPNTATSAYFTTEPSPIHAGYSGQIGAEGPNPYQQQQYVHGGHHYQQTPVSYDTHVPDQKPIIHESSDPSISQAYQDEFLFQQQQRQHSIHGEQNPYVLGSQPPQHTQDYQQYAQASRVIKVGNHQAPDPESHTVPIETEGDPYARLPLQPDSGVTSFRMPQNVPISQHDINQDVKYVAQHTVLEQPVAVSRAQNDFRKRLLTSGFAEDHVSPTQLLDEAAVECEDDDYYDIQSDEDMDDQEGQPMISTQHFSLLLRLHEENTNELSVRRYDTFIYEGILDFYRAEWVANPLKNQKTARVFAHFIYATGPSLSIYEKGPRNPSAMFEGRTPPALQSLWTYTLPMKALGHQGLLHAMLALASLHIAKLQGASVTPSYKHYAYALKRLQRCLVHPTKRYQIATLATSLLLAYYEVMSAEHVKWSTHLVGSRYLLTELDYRSLTQEARRMKAQQAYFEKNFAYQHPDILIDQRQMNKGFKEPTMEPDESLVSNIFGKHLNYDGSGRVFDDFDATKPSSSVPRPMTIKDYETFQDLYWWYARQDAIQSMISGNPLILDYNKWSDCPPRAPFARADALYGSHDHLILLIGRIADFTFRDRERKIKQVEANGGQWRPMPGMPMGPPPPQSQQSTAGPSPITPITPSNTTGVGAPPVPNRAPPQVPPTNQSRMPSTGPPYGLPSQGQPPAMQTPGKAPQHPQMPSPQGPPPNRPQPPAFYGMAPAPPQSAVPSSYSISSNPNWGQFNSHPQPSPITPTTPHTPQGNRPIPVDLPAAYKSAEDEWTNINQAVQNLLSILKSTPPMCPLGPDLAPQLMSPFGPALQFRSYDTGIIWAMLYLANIILIRSHPSMPPAAQMAAGIAAPQTAHLANECGRIAAGIEMPGSSSTEPGIEAPLNPSMGAALVESILALFFAGITYRDPAQREWTVNRLLEIDRRTGFSSAGIIARGCETAWERAGEAGRAPPYPNRKTKRPGEDGAKDNLGPRRVRTPGEERVMEIDDEAERRFVLRDLSGRLPWAMNLLATEEDVRAKWEQGTVED